jgi:hypothetical protein
MDKLKLETLIREESIGLSVKERRKLYREVADYLLIRCHNDFYDSCKDECDKCRRCLK